MPSGLLPVDRGSRTVSRWASHRAVRVACVAQLVTPPSPLSALRITPGKRAFFSWRRRGYRRADRPIPTPVPSPQTPPPRRIIPTPLRRRHRDRWRPAYLVRPPARRSRCTSADGSTGAGALPQTLLRAADAAGHSVPAGYRDVGGGGVAVPGADGQRARRRQDLPTGSLGADHARAGVVRAHRAHFRAASAVRTRCTGHRRQRVVSGAQPVPGGIVFDGGSHGAHEKGPGSAAARAAWRHLPQRRRRDGVHAESARVHAAGRTHHAGAAATGFPVVAGLCGHTAGSAGDAGGAGRLPHQSERLAADPVLRGAQSAHVGVLESARPFTTGQVCARRAAVRVCADDQHHGRRADAGVRGARRHLRRPTATRPVAVSARRRPCQREDGAR
eukprot:ctg_1114.g461